MIAREQLAQNPEARLSAGGEVTSARYLTPAEVQELNLDVDTDKAVFLSEGKGNLTHAKYLEAIEIPFGSLGIRGDSLTITDKNMESTFYWSNGFTHEREIFSQLSQFLQSRRKAA